jgi:NitT/TauT family transport system substrate-binding protein
VLAVAAALCGLSSNVAAAEKILFGLAGVPTFGYAPFVFAREMGFFAEEGLSLDIVALQGSGEILPQLVRGTIFTSMLTPDLAILSRQPGKANFPVRFAYNTYRRSIWQMAVLDDSPIRSIADMKGKTIGVGALTFASVVQTKALLRRNGINPADASFVAVGVGVPAFEALRRKKIDVLNLYDAAIAAFAGQGASIRQLPYPPEVRLSSSHGLVFSDRTIADRPDLVARFGRALAKGTVACAANVDACMDAHWKAYPAQKPAELDDATRNRFKASLQAVLDGMTSFQSGSPAKFGSYSDEDWTVTIDTLRSGGELSDTPISLSSLYTNEFVGQFNDFDVEAVRRRAREH